MTTFLPYPSFEASADCLDPVRRWKQVVEGVQILDALLGKPTKAGKPYRIQGAMALCVEMWTGRVDALKQYVNWCLHFVRKYGTHRVTAYQPFDLAESPEYPAIRMPWWLGDDRVHSSHRSRLLAKDPEFYGKYGWDDDPSAPYYWPKSKRPRNPLFGDRAENG